MPAIALARPAVPRRTGDPHGPRRARRRAARAGVGPAGAAPSTGSFPAGIEPLARYVGQSTCDPTEKPGTVALRSLVQATYPSVNGGGISRACDVGGRSEHKEGRAWDWMLDASDPVEAARAEDFLTWLLAPDAQGNRYAMARRLGVMYVIWNAKVWESYAADDGLDDLHAGRSRTPTTSTSA